MAEENMTEEERRGPREHRPVSRRRFLFGSGLALGGAVVASVTGATLAPTTAEADGGTAAPPLSVSVVDRTTAIQKATGHVERDLQACAGCRTCEAVCSLNHDGVVSPALARTWIVDYILEGRRIEGYTCRQCEGPECLYACPTQALHIDAETGARIIDQEKCIGCQSCIKACPQYPNSPIRFNANTKKSLKCDLCGGEPLCVKFCPEGAMSLVKES